MKLFARLITLSLAVLVTAAPLGNRAVFSRRSSIILPRRFILRSDIEAPAACLARTNSSVNATDVNLDNSTTDNSTSADTTALKTDDEEDESLDDTTDGEEEDVDADNTVPDEDEDNVDSDDTASESDEDGEAEDDQSATQSKRAISTDLGLTDSQILCLVSGGDIFSALQASDEVSCINWAGFDGTKALFANADPCEQQDNADLMISFAKAIGGRNMNILIDHAIAYRQYPREVVEVLDVFPATPYCLKAPVNPELFGVSNAQLEGVDVGLYGGPNFPLVAFGEEGTCPFGQTPDIETCTCIDSDVVGTATEPTSESETASLTASSSAADATVTAEIDDEVEGDDSDKEVTDIDDVDPTDAPSATTDDDVDATDAPTTTADADVSSNTLTADINDPRG